MSTPRFSQPLSPGPASAASRRSAPERLRSGWRALLWVLAVTGLVWPWYHTLSWLAAGGSLAPGVFFPAAFANALTASITVDVYLAAVAFSVAVVTERRVRRPGWYVAACFGLGLAFALPLYLLQRDAAAGEASAGRPG